jgi:hypothetical protein
MRRRITMKTKIKKLTTAAAVFAMALSVQMTAFADSEDFTREEIIDEYWTQYWEDSLPGDENPEGSLEYHILESFLDEQYGHTYFEDKSYLVTDWSSDVDVRTAWKKYYEKYTENWHYVDDDDTGEFYIESYDPDTDTYGDDKLYTFKLQDGKWNMIDSNGNVADSFDPHGGDGSWDNLEDDEPDITYDVGGYVNGKYQGNDGDDVNVVNGTTAENRGTVTDSTGTTADTTKTPSSGVNGQNSAEKEKTTVKVSGTKKSVESSAADSSEADTDSKESSSEKNNNISEESESESVLPYVIGGFIIVGAAIAGVLVAMQREKGDKK